MAFFRDSTKPKGFEKEADFTWSSAGPTLALSHLLSQSTYQTVFIFLTQKMDLKTGSQLLHLSIGKDFLFLSCFAMLMNPSTLQPLGLIL